MNLAQEKKFKMNSNYYDIYISYNSAQLEEGVTLICDYLRKWFKLNIWFDQDKHENNDSSYCEFDALQSSLIFICFPSKEYKKSIKNRIEYSIALKQEMRIIELRLFDDMRDFKLPNTTQIKLYDLLDRPNSNEFRKIIYYIKFEVDKMKHIYWQPFKKGYSFFKKI
jgi:hypothetical protein